MWKTCLPFMFIFFWIVVKILWDYVFFMILCFFVSLSLIIHSIVKGEKNDFYSVIWLISVRYWLVAYKCPLSKSWFIFYKLLALLLKNEQPDCKVSLTLPTCQPCSIPKDNDKKNMNTRLCFKQLPTYTLEKDVWLRGYLKSKMWIQF